MNEWVFNGSPAHENKQIGCWVSNKWYLHKNIDGKSGYIKNSYSYNTV